MKLRRVERKDFDRILEIVNQPEAREASFYGKKIYKKSHYKYWNKRLRNKMSFAITNEKEVIGVIKIDNNEVSITVDKKYYRKGLAFRALSKIGLDGTKALIKPGNIASIKLFKKLGYKEKMVIYEKNSNSST